MTDVRTTSHPIRLVILFAVMAGVLVAQAPTAEQGPEQRAKTFAQLKKEGALRSSYRSEKGAQPANAVPEPRLAEFERDIKPILVKTCGGCHGPDKQKGNLRLDTLDPDLFGGDDVDWWLEVQAVLTNGEMPPEDDEDDYPLSDADRTRVIDWLTTEVQSASTVRRGSAKHTSFRRLTRYEYSYALQDLLGRKFDFGADLPPDPTSHDGFLNSSEMLHLSPTQFRAYLDAARKALRLVTVSGAQPAPQYWSVPMAQAAEREWGKQAKQLANTKKKHAKNPEKQAAELKKLKERFARKPRGAYFKDGATGRVAKQTWGYNGAKHAWAPAAERPEVAAGSDMLAVLPPRQTMTVELGDRLPDRGTMRVRVRAARASTKGPAPSMELLFGWQASNDSSANFRVSDREIVIAAAAGEPQFYEWDIAMSQVYPRNLMRKTAKLGELPNPSEYLKLRNASLSAGDILIDHVEVLSPVYDVWPPASHTAIFAPAGAGDEEEAGALAVLRSFMTRAWRRDVSDAELRQKHELYRQLRPQCADFVEAVVETLATVLSSPNFLYVGTPAAATPDAVDIELATRLSMFLWCSTPDAELLAAAKNGKLREPVQLVAQVERMLGDTKARRFSREFVRQWLGLDLLDFLHVDRKANRGFDTSLKESMGEEPIVFFAELLAQDLSVLEFLHCNFAMVNERLAKHYRLEGVAGNEFRRVSLPPGHRRGGLLTQAGLLAMNSDGIDSHPLKRGVWLLERLLNDPPPPPPPAVPEIDLADPRIAKMTLKERIEDHRNHPACMSCHSKIDPWGIAFENFDAIGRFRDKVKGRPVDSVSVLFNKQKLDGTDGLKRFLLEHRQDQFVRAMVHKLTTFALGRPLSFGDRAAIEEITAKTRMRGDGLATMIETIVTSDLFRSN